MRSEHPEKGSLTGVFFGFGDAGGLIVGASLIYADTLGSKTLNCSFRGEIIRLIRFCHSLLPFISFEGEGGATSFLREIIKEYGRGTLWVNLGDTYGGTGKKSDTNDKYKKGLTRDFDRPNGKEEQKCLLQIPSRFAIEMCNRGWILRNEIIWHKPNCMPSSADDRFTVDFEKVFLFVKSKRYYFEQILEPYADSSEVRYRQALRANRSYNSKEPYKVNSPYSGTKKRGTGSVASRGDDADGLVVGGDSGGRNKRTMWSINTKPYNEAHFATFPEELIEPMVISGCPKGGIVMDIFMGAGTTGVVAKKLGRQWLGIELNEDYIKIAEERIAGQTPPML